MVKKTLKTTDKNNWRPKEKPRNHIARNILPTKPVFSYFAENQCNMLLLLATSNWIGIGILVLIAFFIWKVFFRNSLDD
jgi:hypothetical protein